MNRKPTKILSFLPETHVEPPCPHFREGCGGCLLQDSAYGDQIIAKELLLEDIYGRRINVVPCPDELGYRNRMDFVCAFGKKGLRQRGKHTKVVDVKDCLLLPVPARDVYKAVRDAFTNVRDYDYLKHKGFLRYVVIRTSHATSETMLIVTTRTPKDRDDHEKFQKILDRLHEKEELRSVYWMVNDSKTDVSIGEPFWHIGEEWITDEIASRRFRVYPETFFQANTELIGVLFQEAIHYAEGKVLDLYCGVGALSIMAAQYDEVDSVIGVEINPASVEAAKENAILNEVPTNKCEFVREDAARYLKEYDEKFDTIMCDPARQGLEKACSLILKLRPKKIIYISCNPITHQRDLEKLSTEYDITVLEAFDLFPQTPHIEVLSVLELKSSE